MSTLPSFILAQDEPQSVFGIIVSVLFVLAAALAFVLLVGYVRKRVLAKEEPGMGAGFTLGDLRALHRAGKMTDEEFERAKGLVIATAKRDAAKIKPAGAPGFPVQPGPDAGTGDVEDLPLATKPDDLPPEPPETTGPGRH
jgi:hypothetical protein